VTTIIWKHSTEGEQDATVVDEEYKVLKGRTQAVSHEPNAFIIYHINEEEHFVALSEIKEIRP
jgi:hypothetical protein